MTVEDHEVPAREAAEAFWDRLLELDPLMGTMTGDERFDDRLPDPTDAGVAERETFYRATLETLQRFDVSRVSVATRGAIDLIQQIARRGLDEVAYRLDRFAAASHLAGPGSLLATIGSLQRADTPERSAKYVDRLRAFPSYLDEVGRVAAEGARIGQVVPRLVVDRAMGQVERLLELDPDQSPVLAPLAAASDQEREQVRRLAREDTWPALRRYRDVLRDYAPAARDTIGLSALSDGEEMYAAEIRGWTTLSMDPRLIHDIGVADLERIQVERRATAERLGYADPVSALAAHQASGRNTPGSRQEMVRLAEDQVRRGWEAAPRFFGRMPTSLCEVKPVEEFREADMPFAFYFPPSQDGSRSAIYYVNTSNLSERQLHFLATTTYHEAIPGHHLQTALEQEMQDRPSVRRFGGILGGSAFIEGWGLYSERLADEMGLFVDDYERLGMLGAQGMRAARLVVDTGIHALGWDRDRSIATLEEAGVPTVDATVETDRYIAMPGQALSYKLGQIEIERWRAEAADREGSSFSLPGFHDRLLALGSLPLPALDREMQSSQ
jgi:uncharacterized protein (DUF885 family)